MEKQKKGRLGLYISNSALFIATVALAFFSKGLIGGWAVAVSITLSAILLILTITLTHLKKETASKLLFLCHVVVVFVMLLAFFFHKIGIFKVASSVEEMRDFITQFGYAKWAYIGIQFFQVLLLPIPTTITLLAGLLLFDPWLVVWYSMVGIVPASIIMFFFGRFAGRGAVNWVLGKDSVDKYLDMIKGKDVSLLTVMFIMPMFPDDTLCAIAGLSTMKFSYFLPVIFVTRIIMCIMSVFLFGSNMIPFHGWGLVVWALIAAATIALLVLMWKKGDKIQNTVASWFKKKNKPPKNTTK
ncbi:MAG: VTT domain-containing protein [Clostridia bacterium]